MRELVNGEFSKLTFFKEYQFAFAKKSQDMIGIYPTIAIHKLNVDYQSRHRRAFGVGFI